MNYNNLLTGVKNMWDQTVTAFYPVYGVVGVSIGGWLDEEAVWNVDGDVNLFERCARVETNVFILWWLLHISFPS